MNKGKRQIWNNSNNAQRANSSTIYIGLYRSIATSISIPKERKEGCILFSVFLDTMYYTVYYKLLVRKKF